MVSELVSSSVYGTQNTRSDAIPWSPVLFRRYSIRTQLLLALVFLWTIGCLIGGVVTILQARKSTRIEVSAAMNLNSFCRKGRFTARSPDVDPGPGRRCSTYSYFVKGHIRFACRAGVAERKRASAKIC